jgi:hypothetical protein
MLLLPRGVLHDVRGARHRPARCRLQVGALAAYQAFRAACRSSNVEQDGPEPHSVFRRLSAREVAEEPDM